MTPTPNPANQNLPSNTSIIKPLMGLRVVDFSQFLAGPACSLRLADFGAEVIKVERPEMGDICRHLYVAKQKIGGESTIFHAINRNKKSIALDLKNPADKQKILNIIKTADVVIQNFRPGVAQRLGIDYETLKQLNPKLIYGSVSGYGADNKPWLHKPGQDLLAQALSGLTHLTTQNRHTSSIPTPMGLSIADLATAYDLTQGILALLVRRGKTSMGGIVETSLMETLLGYQVIPLSQHLNNTPPSYGKIIQGIFATQDGYLALIAESFNTLSNHMGQSVNTYDHITTLFKTQPTDHWVSLFENSPIPCSAVFDWLMLRNSPYYQSLSFEQKVHSDHYPSVHTTRCPIKIDNTLLTSPLGIPAIGEHNNEF